MARFFGVERLGFQDSLSGTTTNSYADALDWNSEGFQNKTLILKNTHGSNSLHYKVLVRCEYDGNDAEEVAETTLAAGGLARIALNNVYARVKLQVKAATADSQATYQLDYIGLPAGIP